MTLDFTCDCGRRLSAPDQRAGTQGTCPSCGSSFRYPPAPPRARRIVITGRTPEKRPLDRGGETAAARRRRLILLLVPLVLLSLVGALVWGYILLSHRSQDRHARASVLANLERADRLAETGESLQAWLAYRATAAQASRHLRSQSAPAPELRAASARASTRAIELERDGLRVPTSPPRDATAAAPSALVVDPPSSRPDAAARVRQDPRILYLDLARLDPDTRFTVAGLGVLPGDPLSRFLEVWGEPDRREPAEETGQERWSYRDRLGFDVVVNSPAPAGATPLDREGRLMTVHVFPNFAGKLARLGVKDASARDFTRAYGTPERSLRSLLSYERPFHGTVQFDDGGRFEELTVYFQRTRR